MLFSVLHKVTLSSRRWLYGVLGVAFLLLVLSLWVLRSCNAPTEQNWQLRYQPAMKPEFQPQLLDLATAPRYDIDVQLNQKMDLLSGQATIRVVNTSTDIWPYLVFRLYPMLDQYDGALSFQSVAVGNQPVPYVNLADNSAMRMDLPTPLAPQAKIAVRLVWKLSIPTWLDDTQTYALFGKSQAMLSLPLFYPALAVYQPGPTPNSGQWWLDEGSVRGDAAFNVTSLFVVTATLPSDQIPVTSGTLITSTLIGKNLARHVWVTGPVREFLLHTSAQFASANAEAYGTRVTSYWLPGQEAAGKAALTYATAALRIYSDLYGPYPYHDLRIAPAPMAYRGMEYPQVSLLGTELYTLFRPNLEILVAHEVAHQWWYQIVGNDPVKEPWLDEALAEYSVKFYMEEMYGKSEADRLQANRWQLPVDDLKKHDGDAALDQPVNSFSTSKQYETIIYGKGALYYDQLRKTVGDRQFTQLLQSYLAKERYGIANSADWFATVHALKNPALDQLYKDWVQSPPMTSLPTATPPP